MLVELEDRDRRARRVVREAGRSVRRPEQDLGAGLEMGAGDGDVGPARDRARSRRDTRHGRRRDIKERETVARRRLAARQSDRDGHVLRAGARRRHGLERRAGHVRHGRGRRAAERDRGRCSGLSQGAACDVDRCAALLRAARRRDLRDRRLCDVRERRRRDRVGPGRRVEPHGDGDIARGRRRRRDRQRRIRGRCHGGRRATAERNRQGAGSREAAAYDRRRRAAGHEADGGGNLRDAEPATGGGARRAALEADGDDQDREHAGRGACSRRSPSLRYGPHRLAPRSSPPRGGRLACRAGRRARSFPRPGHRCPRRDLLGPRR